MIDMTSLTIAPANNVDLRPSLSTKTYQGRTPLLSMQRLEHPSKPSNQRDMTVHAVPIGSPGTAWRGMASIAESRSNRVRV